MQSGAFGASTIMCVRPVWMTMCRSWSASSRISLAAAVTEHVALKRKPRLRQVGRLRECDEVCDGRDLRPEQAGSVLEGLDRPALDSAEDGGADECAALRPAGIAPAAGPTRRTLGRVQRHRA